MARDDYQIIGHHDRRSVTPRKYSSRKARPCQPLDKKERTVGNAT
jgi:hypothetical protein